MLFNSFEFLIFFIIVYTLYFFLSHHWQNRMLILASCLFYSAWNWKFLILMFLSITIDYFCSNKIYGSGDKKIRRKFLFLSIFVNLSILGVFKYFNFFLGNLEAAVSWLFPALPFEFTHALNIILPVGISFYTFEAISYTVDVYRGIMRPAKCYWDYVLFVIYFPHLVAGPIMRAKDLLPQISQPRVLRLEQFYEGCYLISWGFFEKIFVADNLAKIVDPIFLAPPPYDGGKVLIAVYAFAFQIFCDFDGYSNIARGLGKCMGFDITINFRWPYCSTNPVEFWQRWHISLSSWLRDYLYIPLGGNRQSVAMTYRNLLLTMLLGGLWHGASWTFIVWGAYHGILLIAYRIMISIVKKFSFSTGAFSKGKTWFLIRIIFFFHLTCIGWLIFRAGSMAQVDQMLMAIFIHPFSVDMVNSMRGLVFCVTPVLVIHAIQYCRNDLMVVLKWPIFLRALFYFVCFYLLMVWGVEGGKEFVYFQF